MTTTPFLYSMNFEISKETDIALRSFSNFTKIPVTYFDSNGLIKREYGSQNKLCKFLPIYNQENSDCKKKLNNAQTTATGLGEPYFFTCNAGFLNIAIPLIYCKENYGCFVAGPIIMEHLNNKELFRLILDNSLETIDTKKTLENGFKPNTSISRTAKIDVDILTRILSIIRTSKIFTTSEVRDIATLFNSCVMTNLIDFSEYDKINSYYKDQSRIGETLQELKGTSFENVYPYELEKALIEALSNGDMTAGKKLMSNYVNSVLLFEVGNLDMAKAHLIEVLALVTRHDFEQANFSVESTLLTSQHISNLKKDYISRNNFEYLSSIQSIDDIKSFKEWANSFVLKFERQQLNKKYSGNSPFITEVLQYISAPDGLKTNLTKMASQLHLNASYLSTLFKQEMGINFSDYLATARINKAKDLLSKTNLELIDIATECGFQSQSYFSSVFNSAIGMSPTEYRRKK